MCLLEGIFITFNETKSTVQAEYRALYNTRTTRRYSTNILWMPTCRGCAVNLVSSLSQTFLGMCQFASSCIGRGSEMELLWRYIRTYVSKRLLYNESHKPNLRTLK
jgi:hypothetical protein